MDAKLISLLRTHPIFAPLSDSAIAQFVGQGRRMIVEAGEILIGQGDPSDCAFILLDGEADVYVETAYGPVVLNSLGHGQFFGEIGTLAAMPRTATVRARSTIEVLHIDGELILAIARSHPDLLLSVIRQLGERMVTINRAIGFYTQALAALERHDFDPSILDELLNPVPELLSFAHTFRRMAEQIILRRAHDQEMASAAAIQRAMLPAPLALAERDSRIDIYALIRPAREVGGDLYNYFPMGPDRIAIVIGDVSGKGVPASLFMGITQTVIQIALREIDDLATAVGRANQFLSRDNRKSMFATLFCGVLELSSGTLTYCNCGHNPPLVLRAAGACEGLATCGPALAVVAPVAYRPRTIVLAPGDRLLLYTDGITEAENATQEQFGEDRLAAACGAPCGAAAQDLVEEVVRRVDEFASGAPQSDDIACVALCYHAASTLWQLGEAVAYPDGR